jgi:ribose 5-phosphate isomerase
VGTGSTANFFIDELAKVKHKIEQLEWGGVPKMILVIANKHKIYFKNILQL